METVNEQLLYKKDKKCFTEVTNSGKYGQTKAFDNNFIPLNSLTGKNFKNDHTKPSLADVTIATQGNVPFGIPVSKYLYQFPKYANTIDDVNLTKKVD